MPNNIPQIITTHSAKFCDLLSPMLLKEKFFVFDLTKNNPDLASMNYNSPQFDKYIFSNLKQNQCAWGIGRYNEDRVIYSQSIVFDGVEHRSIHLGIDLWAPAGTPLYLPIPGQVYSIKNNIGVGDYGPTVIMEHTIDDTKFFALYGHLDPEVLARWQTGDEILAGQQFARMGKFADNGNWPAHVHFQIITDMMGRSGDFIGVAKPSEREYWTTICPDPNLILRLLLN